MGTIANSVRLSSHTMRLRVPSMGEVLPQSVMNFWSAVGAGRGRRWAAGPGVFASEGDESGVDGVTPMGDYHAPVMPDECMAALRPAEGKVMADLTLGGGGHAERMLEAGATVYGFDQDLEAIQFASERLARFGSRFIPVHSNFCGIERELGLRGVERLDGVLIDLGVSSRQLDAPERGFSFMREGPLDMRMDANDPTMPTAADLVNTWEAEELARIFFQYGEEKFSRKIAREIVSYRSLHPVETTMELADLIERVVPKRGPKHPATRVFQALRIAVNHEMSVLEQTLDALPRMLGDHGRLAIITFHSLEDRMVKLDFRKRSEQMLDHESWPEPRPNPDYAYRLIKRKPLLPSDAEIRLNPRSRSAKVRVAERLPRS